MTHHYKSLGVLLILFGINLYGMDQQISSACSSTEQTDVLSKQQLNMQLIKAIREGDVAKMTTLIDQGAEIDSLHNDEIDPIQAAIMTGNFESMKELIGSGDTVDSCLSGGMRLLHCAVLFGSDEMVKYLLDGKIEIDAKQCLSSKQNLDYTALQFAVRRKSSSIMCELIERGADKNIQTLSSRTLLHLASKSGSEACVQVCLDIGFELEAEDFQGLTPLHTACQAGSVKVVELLIDAGAQINAPVRQKDFEIEVDYSQGLAPLHSSYQFSSRRLEDYYAGWCPLHFAALSNAHEIVTLLTQKGVEIDAETAEGETPLWLATEKNAVESIKELVRGGANLLVQDGENETLLHSAARYGSRPLVEFFVEKGLDPDSADKRGNRPLHLAAGYGSIEVVEYLLEKGVAVNPKNENGSTPLYGAIIYRDLEKTNVLLKYVSSLNARMNEIDGSLLHDAVHKNFPQGIEVLAENGAYLEQLGRSGMTPLLLAASLGNFQCMKKLILKGANIQTQCDKKGTLLHHSAYGGSEKCVRFCLECNFKVEAEDDKGYRPLHYAAQSGVIEAVRLLVKKGASLDAITRNRESPLHLAARNNHVKALQMLLSYGADWQIGKYMGHKLEGSMHAEIMNILLIDGGVDSIPSIFVEYIPLHEAISKGNIACMEILLEKGVEKILAGGLFRTALEGVRIKRETVETLLKNSYRLVRQFYDELESGIKHTQGALWYIDGIRNAKGIDRILHPNLKVGLGEYPQSWILTGCLETSDDLARALLFEIGKEDTSDVSAFSILPITERNALFTLPAVREAVVDYIIKTLSQCFNLVNRKIESLKKSHGEDSNLVLNLTSWFCKKNVRRLIREGINEALDRCKSLNVEKPSPGEEDKDEPSGDDGTINVRNIKGLCDDN